MELSRQECTVLRGVAIISIFIHNYCHLLPNAPKENEYSWSIERVLYFWDIFPNDIFISLFSFLGHYGVPVFVFLSGYGLVNKYERNDTEWSYGNYFSNHYLKLVKLMFPGLISYLILFWFLYGDFDGMNFYRVIAQLLLVNNLIPTKYLPIVPGPYWYFGLTMQLYLLFLILRSKKRNIVICVTICLFLMILSNGHHYLIVWLKYNFVGHAIPFIMGILYAKYHTLFKYDDSKWSVALISIFSFIFLLASELYFYSWIIAPVFVIVFVFSIAKLLNGWLVSFLSFVGALSHVIFVAHPVTRVFVYYIQDEYHMKWQIGLLIYILLTISLSSLIFYIGRLRGATKENR